MGGCVCVSVEQPTTAAAHHAHVRRYIYKLVFNIPLCLIACINKYLVVEANQFLLCCSTRLRATPFPSGKRAAYHR